MFCIPVRRCPSSPLLSRVDFLGEMRDFPHSGVEGVRDDVRLIRFLGRDA